jgi:hypothetical protein
MAKFSDSYHRKLDLFQGQQDLGLLIPKYSDPKILEQLKGSAVVVPLTSGQYTLVDLEDEPLIRQYKWQAKRDKYGHWYAYRESKKQGARSYEAMHRLLMGCNRDDGLIVDHINGDGLDNRRSINLRICTNKQNVRNARLYSNKKTSKLRGVSFIKDNQRFRAQIMCSGVKINLGNFTDEKTAALAYDEAAHKLFGEYARLNFPERIQKSKDAA